MSQTQWSGLCRNIILLVGKQRRLGRLASGMAERVEREERKADEVGVVQQHNKKKSSSKEMANKVERAPTIQLKD